jgi:hypothetical protein
MSATASSTRLGSIKTERPDEKPGSQGGSDLVQTHARRVRPPQAVQTRPCRCGCPGGPVPGTPVPLRELAPVPLSSAETKFNEEVDAEICAAYRRWRAQRNRRSAHIGDGARPDGPNRLRSGIATTFLPPRARPSPPAMMLGRGRDLFVRVACPTGTARSTCARLARIQVRATREARRETGIASRDSRGAGAVTRMTHRSTRLAGRASKARSGFDREGRS